MKIAILTSGILPVPAVLGGAVENLIDFYLDYNNKHKIHDITIYSVYNKKVKKHPAQKSTVNHYEYININSIWFKVRAKIFERISRPRYYYYQMEFFLELIIKKIRKTSFDLIILENRPGFAIRLSEEFSTPIITHIHTNLLHIPSEKNLRIMAAIKGFIVVSEFVKQEILGIGIPKDIRVVYNGLDTELFNPKTVIPINRERLGFKKEDFVAVFWGRLVPDKGIKELLMAFEMMKEQKDIKLLIIGSINFEDKRNCTDAFSEELQSIAYKLNSVVSFTGFIPYKEIPEYLATANVAIIPSHINEAFGMTCIEACAMGMPVIATNDGGIPEVLIGQKHILIEKEKKLPEQIADAIIKIKNNYSDYKGNVLSPHFNKEYYSHSFFENINIPYGEASTQPNFRGVADAK